MLKLWIEILPLNSKGFTKETLKCKQSSSHSYVIYERNGQRIEHNDSIDSLFRKFFVLIMTKMEYDISSNKYTETTERNKRSPK
jgi:hypothetical protein